MKNLFIVANWKANKTSPEATSWLQEISNIKYQISNTTNREVIVCASFTLLSDLKSYLMDYQLTVKLGAQDISPFDEGAYTGEVNGKQVKEFVDYVLIGHSERRQYFSEDDLMLEKKTEMAKKYNLMPIFCVQNKKTFIPEGVKMVAYEPVEAIGTGNPERAENADETARIIKSAHKKVMYVLYGGSVTSENVSNFTKRPNIDGVLVGGASLDAKAFADIIKNS